MIFYRFLAVCLLILLPLFSSNAEDKAMDLNGKNKELKIVNTIAVTPIAGYRYDIFSWSIPNNGLITGDKLSELTWKNSVIETGVRIETQPRVNNYNFLGHIKYGYILDRSTNQDSDWDDLGEFSKSFSNVKGNSLDISGAVGFSRQMKSAIATYYYGMDYTNYNMRNFGLNFEISRQRHTSIGQETGQIIPTSTKVSTYKFNNYAPWVGASLLYPVNKEFSVTPTVKLYMFYLSAEADWILREDYKHDPSFTDKAFGYGASFDAELAYKFSNSLDLTGNVGFKGFSMSRGIQEDRFANGRRGSSNLKSLYFVSSYANLGMRYKF
jgi:hypothetical protein